MADVFNAVNLHLVWATWDRLPTLTPPVRDVVYQCIRSVGDECGCRVLAIGGVEDHVHVLVGYSTSVTIAGLVKAMKGASSRRVNEAFDGANFKWQGGYGVFPVAPAGLNRVADYIARQEQHHARGTTVPQLEAAQLPRATEELPTTTGEPIP